MRTFTLYAADVTGLQTNSCYSNRREITSNTDLAAAAAFDHVAATYKNNHRSNKNFLASDCVVMDIDNDHTENPRRMGHPRKAV